MSVIDGLEFIILQRVENIYVPAGVCNSYDWLFILFSLNRINRDDFVLTSGVLSYELVLPHVENREETLVISYKQMGISLALSLFNLLEVDQFSTCDLSNSIQNFFRL